MGNKKKIRVGIVGLSFGAEFIPIYQKHPETELVAICRRDERLLNEIGDRWEITKRYTNLEDMLMDADIDAVHINTPPMMHAQQTIAVLKANKHAACTIPMALSVDDCRKIVEAQEETKKTYMMMETTVYSREFLFIKELYDKGEIGRIQFLRASHQQDMTGWPDYWEGLPPMYNSTHCIAPTLSLDRYKAECVSCIGSGCIDPRMHARYGSPFAIESTHIKFKDSDLGAEVTRSLFNTARQYRESFDVYGSKKSFEWTQIEGELHVIHAGEMPSRIIIPDYAHLLPKEIQAFTTGGVYDDKNAHLSFIQGGGHGGSHPHLVHAFVKAILNECRPYPDARQAANITCSGILSHASAMEGGMKIQLPEWTF